MEGIVCVVLCWVDELVVVEICLEVWVGCDGVCFVVLVVWCYVCVE